MKFHVAVIASAFTFVLSMLPCARGGTIQVPADAPTVQAAIDLAGNGDTVLVAPGTYTGPGNRDIDFGGKLISVRSSGGAAVTILDAQGSLFDLHRVFDFHSGEDASALVEGFTLRGGFADPGGGGVSCVNASPTIKSCRFTQNHAAGLSSGGGAVDCIGGSPELFRCTFDLNDGKERGGAVFCSNASPQVGRCTFLMNSADKGGAAFFENGSSPEFSHCDFTSNDSQPSFNALLGGAVHSASSSPSFLECNFTTNGHASQGGAMYLLGGSCDVTSCTFSGNTSGSGGAIFCEACAMDVEDSTFDGNSAFDMGGAFYIDTDFSAVAVIRNNLVSHNTAKLGGAVFSDSADPILDRNRFDTNQTVTPSGYNGLGGALYCRSGSPKITRNTFSGNSATNSELQVHDPSAGGAIYLEASTPVIGGAAGAGNTFSDDWASLGADIFTTASAPVIDARFNTFAVFPPSGFQLKPLAAFDVAGGTGLHPAITQDVSVALGGSDTEGGAGPFKTLRFVTSRVSPAQDQLLTVRVQPGVYSPSTTGELFPVVLVDHVALRGAGSETSILDAEATERVVLAANVQGASLEGLTIRGGLAGVGGGVRVLSSAVVVRGNRITSNVGTWGGGIACSGNPGPEITDNVIDSNQTLDTPFFARLGGGVFCSDGASPVLRNDLVINNLSHDYGGGIACNANANPVIRGSTIVGNAADFGEAVVVWNNSTASLTDCIVRGSASTPGSILSTCCGSTVLASWSDVEGGSPGAGNVDADPLFTNAPAGDYSLAAGSPCIDAGDPLAITLGNDLGGNPRLLDGDLDGVMTGDMGAYEVGHVHLAITGHATPGGLLHVRVTGTAGLPVLLLVGTGAGSTVHPPYGEIAIDLQPPWLSVSFGVIPSVADPTLPLVLPTPLPVFVQAFAFDAPSHAGNVSNLVTLTIE